MLLELVRYEQGTGTQPVILLRWAEDSEPEGTFGEPARFQYLTYDISEPNSVVLEVIRVDGIVDRLGIFNPTGGEWSSVQSWVRVPPRGTFYIRAYYVSDPSVGDQLTGTIIAQPFLDAIWVINNVEDGTSATVSLGTPVQAKVTLSGSDQSFYWGRVGEEPDEYRVPSRGYWQNDTLYIAVPTNLVGVYDYQARLEDINQSLRLHVEREQLPVKVYVRWKPNHSDVQPYGGTFVAQYRTENPDPTDTVRLFVYHNGNRIDLGEGTLSDDWQDFSWQAVPPRGGIIMGAELVHGTETIRDSVYGTIQPQVDFRVDPIQTVIDLSRIPLENFRFRLFVDQSEYPVRIYRNGVLIDTFTPSDRYWDRAGWDYSDRPSVAGVYLYRFVLENEGLEYSFECIAYYESVRSTDPAEMEMRWVGSDTGRFCDFLLFEVRLLNAVHEGYVLDEHGRVIAAVPPDGNWHTYSVQLGSPRGRHTLFGTYNHLILAFLVYSSYAEPDLEVMSPMNRSLRMGQSYRIPFYVRVKRTDRPVRVLINGIERARINVPERGYFCDDTVLWEDEVEEREAIGARNYHFILEDPDAPGGFITRTETFYFYESPRPTDSLIELVRYEVRPESDPPESYRDRFVGIFFEHHLIGTTLYFQILGSSLATPYVNRTGTIFVLRDSRKMGGHRVMVIEYGGDHVV